MSFVTGFTKVAREVFAYRNVHKSKEHHVYSLRGKKSGKVERHAKNVYLKNPKFKVSDKGRERVRKEGVKNVHAGIEGKLVTNVPPVTAWRSVTYDPKKHEGFVDRETAEAVNNAEYAWLTPQGVMVPAQPDNQGDDEDETGDQGDNED